MRISKKTLLIIIALIALIISDGWMFFNSSKLNNIQEMRLNKVEFISIQTKLIIV